jgi:hypothetical protein
MEPVTKEYLRKMVLAAKHDIDTQIETEWLNYKDSLKEYVRQNLREAYTLDINTLRDKIRKYIISTIKTQLRVQKDIRFHIPLELEFLEYRVQIDQTRWWATLPVPMKMPQELNVKSTINEMLESMYGEWRRTYFPAAVFACKGDTPVLQFHIDDIISPAPVNTDLLELNKPIDLIA